MRTLARALTVTIIIALIAAATTIQWTGKAVLTIVVWLTAAYVVYKATEWAKRMHAARVEQDRGDDPQDVAAYDDTCAIDYCNRYATTLFPSSTGVIFVCRKHAGQVSEWTGPAVFDNEQESA